MLSEQVQVVGAFCGGPGGGQRTPPLSGAGSVQRLSPEAARLFMLHPRRSCDFHMVSPPSLISAKSTGKREGNDVFFFCIQRTLRLKLTRTSCWNARFLARVATLCCKERPRLEEVKDKPLLLLRSGGLLVFVLPARLNRGSQSFVTALHTPTKLEKHTAVSGR